MAELNIRVNTQQAAAGAKAFERIINDIKQAARSLDQQNLTQFGSALRSLTSSGANLLAMVNQIADALGRMNYSLQSIRAANYGAAMASDFTKLRDVVRETRAQITGLNTELREAVTLAGRMGTASQRVRRSRAPAAGTTEGDAADTATAAASAMTTALVPATTRALTVFQGFAPVASTIMLATTATTRLTQEMKLLTSGAESADRSLRQLVTTAHRAQTAFRVDPSGGAARANQFFGVVQRPGTPLQLGPGGMGQAGAMVPYQRPPGEPIITPQPGAGLRRYVYQGEAVDRAGTALMNVQQPWTATSRVVEGAGKEFERTKEKKDRLDKNLKDTAQNTIPRFNAAWLATIGVMALFQVRRIISELEELGKALFNTGVEFERAFAIMKAGAGDNTEEGIRRMQAMSDMARKLGLDLTQVIVDAGKVHAAAKGSDIEGRQAEEMIINLGSAMAVFGQHTEKGSGLIKVFTDVLSKGRLQSEELVKQLGNAVPGAFRVVAQSVGMTTTELQDAVAKGSISATQTLVKLAAEIHKIYGAQALENLNRLSGAFNGLKQSITEVALLVVNMSTGIMSGSGGTFGQTLVATFKELSALLQNREIQTRIVELANFITNVLAAAFRGLIVILQFATEHMQFFIAALATLTSAAMVAAVGALAFALQKLYVAAQAFALSSGGRLIFVIAGIAASLGAGFIVADQFAKSMEGVAESMDKVYAERERRRAQQAPGNTNPADQTRAVQEALNRVETEQRRFVEGVRQEAQMLELAAAGVSTLSARYEAYLNVLERIKAQEVKELFDILSPQDAATMKRRLTEALLAAELVKQAVGDIVGMFKSLDQAQEQFSIQAATATADLRAMQEGTFSELGSQIQEQYDQKVIPVMRRVREELRSIADPNLRNTLVGAFNAWSGAMRDNIVHIEKLKNLMAGVTDITKQLRDFRFTSMLTDTAATVRAGESFVDTTLDDTAAVIDSMRKEGFFPDLAPPKIRTLGDELKEGFNPTDVGKEMGRSFTDIFVVAMEASVQKLIDQMKAMAEQQKPTGMTGTGKLQEFPGTSASVLEQAGKYKEFFIKYGKEFDVDPELAARIAKNESNFDPLATAYDKQGRVAGQGLMQIVRSTQRELGMTRPYDAEESIKYGIKYIRQRIDQAGGDVEEGVAGYRGAGRTDRPGRPGDPKYFERVLGGYSTTTEGRFSTGGGTTTAQAAADQGGAQATTAATTAAQTAEAKQQSTWDRVWGALEASDRFQKRVFDSLTGGGKPAAGDERFAADVDKARRARGEIVPDPNAYPKPIGPEPPPAVKVETRAEIEARTKALAEENKRIQEGMEAIRKRTQAIQDADAAGAKAQKEMEQRAAKEREEVKKAQEDLDKRTAQLTKEIELITNLGVVEMSNESKRDRYNAGLRSGRELVEKYNAATNEQIRQAVLLGAAQFTKEAIARGNEYSLSLEKQTEALNNETDALIRNRHESSLTAEASAAFRQRERERLEGGRAFGAEEEARRAQASQEARRAQVRSTVESTITGSDKERRDLQMEIDSLQDNTLERAANLEMRRRNAEQLADAANMLPEEIRRIREANEAIRQTRINLQLANGPLRQYIDSLADFSSEATISTAMQERFAELFKGMEDSIISFTKTGKFNFEDFANSFIENIQRMVLQALIFRPIAEALNQALSPGGGAAPAPGAPAGGGKTNWISTVFGLVKTGIGAYTGNPALITSGATQTVGSLDPAMMSEALAATGGWVTEHGIQRFQGGGMAGVGTDTVPAMLTPGEMVLNREQQANVFGKKEQAQNNTFNMVFPNVSNEDQARKTAAQAYSEISSRLERQRQRDGIRTRR